MRKEQKIVAPITFGYMDPGRSNDKNAELFLSSRILAIKSFEKEGVCTLATFENDSIEDSDRSLSNDIGPQMAELRDAFYSILTSRDVNIKFTVAQSLFIYVFTFGVNKFSLVLLDGKRNAIYDDEEDPITVDKLLRMDFPIHAPEWLVNALNMEMPALGNVFCDFRDNLLIPVEVNCPDDHRLLTDAITSAFIWSHVAGIYWFQEVVKQICERLSLAESTLDQSGIVTYQVKRAMQPIGKEDIKRILASMEIFSE